MNHKSKRPTTAPSIHSPSSPSSPTSSSSFLTTVPSQAPSNNQPLIRRIPPPKSVPPHPQKHKRLRRSSRRSTRLRSRSAPPSLPSLYDSNRYYDPSLDTTTTTIHIGGGTNDNEPTTRNHLRRRRRRLDWEDVDDVVRSSGDGGGNHHHHHRRSSPNRYPRRHGFGGGSRTKRGKPRNKRRNKKKNVARDLHDFFKLIVLVPIIVLNILNWNWESFTSYLLHHPYYDYHYYSSSGITAHGLNKRRFWDRFRKIKPHKYHTPNYVSTTTHRDRWLPTNTHHNKHKKKKNNNKNKRRKKGGTTTNPSFVYIPILPHYAYSGWYYSYLLCFTTVYLVVDSLWIVYFPGCGNSMDGYFGFHPTEANEEEEKKKKEKDEHRDSDDVDVDDDHRITVPKYSDGESSSLSSSSSLVVPYTSSTTVTATRSTGVTIRYKRNNTNTILYLHRIILLLSRTVLPWYHPPIRGLATGFAGGTNDINSWFGAARRVFNREGFPPWVVVLPDFSSGSGGGEGALLDAPKGIEPTRTGTRTEKRMSSKNKGRKQRINHRFVTRGSGRWNVLRIKLVSIGFYTSWVLVRLGVYPLVLWEYWGMYRSESSMEGETNGVGTLNLTGVCLLLHGLECGLNLVWTWELVMGKVREWRSS